MTTERITREDIENQLRALQSDVTGKVMSQKQKLVVGAAVATVLVLALTYFMGRARGKRKTTIVEIRRV
jgi:hypothetical protein